MKKITKFISALIASVAILLSPMTLCGENARDVLDRVARQSFGENFRTVMTITTWKGSKEVSYHVLWVMGQHQSETTSIFMDFEEPEEQKGLRYLFQMQPGKEIRAFMYDPSVKKTLSIGPKDRYADIGGTGLIMDDIGGILPRPGETETMLRQEKFQGRECSVILISRIGEKAGRHLWVDARHNLVVKSLSLNVEGKVVREMNVVEFFRTDQGQEFPRETEIRIPGRNMRIRLRQNGVRGVEIPPEVMDPEKFGDYKWLL